MDKLTVKDVQAYGRGRGQTNKGTVHRKLKENMPTEDKQKRMEE